MRKALAIASLLAQACTFMTGPDLPAPIRFADDLTTEEVDAWVNAAVAWNARVGTQVFYFTGEQNDDCGVVVVRGTKLSAEKGEGGLDVERGLCRATVQVRASASPDERRILTEHELGHVARDDHKHNLDPRSVMFWQYQPGEVTVENPDGNSTQEILDSDVSVVRKRMQ